jgi:transcriptional regulator with XRE-family HTH domain
MTSYELTTNLKKFGRHIQQIRHSKKMSLKDVSYNCSLGDGRISEIEQGQRNITFSTILELSKGLETTPVKLMDY